MYRFPAHPITPEQAQDYVQSVLRAARHDPRQEYTLAACLHSTGTFVGFGSLWIRSPEFRNAEIGYTVHLDYWGQGLGTEIARLLLQLGVEYLYGGVNRGPDTGDPSLQVCVGQDFDEYFGISLSEL